MAKLANASERVLLCAKLPGDAALAAGILMEAGLDVQRCRDFTALSDGIREGAGVIVIGHDVQDRSELTSLIEALSHQPPWSAIPVIIIEQPFPGTELARSTFHKSLKKVVVLERPLRIASFVSTVQMALEERRQQYRIRDLLDQRAAELQQRDRFLAMLSHELRNPLAAIVNAASVLELISSEAPEEKAVRGIIVRQASQMKRLVDDMLDVSRLTRGKLRVTTQSLDLTRLLHELIDEMRPDLERGGKLLEVSLPDKPLLMLGDEIRLRQLFGNLLANASKYTDGDGHIWVSAADVGAGAEVKVRDNGAGMTEQMLSRLFEPFAQAETTLHLSEGGLGLGLYLAQSLAALHGGEITASSDGPGRGSEFRVKLPLAQPSDATEEANAMAAGRTCGKHTGKRVLLVEDNLDIAAGLRLMLMDAGYEVQVAKDGATALWLAEQSRPDAVVLDIGLPDIDGYEIAYQLRRRLAFEDIPIVALSGFGSEADRKRSNDAGIDYHLTKPASMADLEQALSCRERH